MKDRVFALPKRRGVRHPDGRPLRPEGEWVSLSTWWRRRRNDGSVELLDNEPRQLAAAVNEAPEPEQPQQEDKPKPRRRKKKTSEGEEQ